MAFPTGKLQATIGQSRHPVPTGPEGVAEPAPAVDIRTLYAATKAVDDYKSFASMNLTFGRDTGQAFVEGQQTIWLPYLSIAEGAARSILEEYYPIRHPMRNADPNDGSRFRTVRGEMNRLQANLAAMYEAADLWPAIFLRVDAGEDLFSAPEALDRAITYHSGLLYRLRDASEPQNEAY
jgi:hypothetical protein